MAYEELAEIESIDNIDKLKLYLKRKAGLIPIDEKIKVNVVYDAISEELA